MEPQRPRQVVSKPNFRCSQVYVRDEPEEKSDEGWWPPEQTVMAAKSVMQNGISRWKLHGNVGCHVVDISWSVIFLVSMFEEVGRMDHCSEVP